MQGYAARQQAQLTVDPYYLNYELHAKAKANAKPKWKPHTRWATGQARAVTQSVRHSSSQSVRQSVSQSFGKGCVWWTALWVSAASCRLALRVELGVAYRMANILESVGYRRGYLHTHTRKLCCIFLGCWRTHKNALHSNPIPSNSIHRQAQCEG